MGGEYPGHWPKPQHGWTLTIEGDPSMRTHFMSLASFTRDATMEEHVRSASVATGMQVLNAVPAVCEAPPGFATSATLPLIRSYAGFRRESANGLAAIVGSVTKEEVTAATVNKRERRGCECVRYITL